MPPNRLFVCNLEYLRENIYKKKTKIPDFNVKMSILCDGEV